MHLSAKRSALTPFFVLVFHLAIYVDDKNILYKKSLIRFITGTNLLKGSVDYFDFSWNSCK